MQDPIDSETYVELNECQMKVWEGNEDVIHVVVTGQGQQILMDKPLREILHVNFFTWLGWTDDPNCTDVYPDGTADIVRVPNGATTLFATEMWRRGIR